jgi:hypothetical protein
MKEPSCGITVVQITQILLAKSIKDDSNGIKK